MIFKEQTTRSNESMIGRRFILRAATAIPMLFLAGRHPACAMSRRLFSTRVIHSGHSLTDPIVPILDAMVAALRQHETRTGNMARSTIPGSPMDWRWKHRKDYGPDARYDIANYDLLVITERVPLSNTVEWHNSGDMAVKWFKHAWKFGNDGRGAETILYATWVNINSGAGSENPHNDPEAHLSFRERMPLEMTLWQDIADQVNEERPAGSPPMRVIPGPLIMTAVYDAIVAGSAPEIEKFEDLFIDMVHPNYQGAYLIALAHLAVIYGTDPRTSISGLGGVEVPHPATAEWMKQLVHDVLRNYPDSGYTGS